MDEQLYQSAPINLNPFALLLGEQVEPEMTRTAAACPVSERRSIGMDRPVPFALNQD